MHTDTSSFYHRARKGALKHDLAHLLAGSELMFHSVTRARAANISSEDGKGTSIEPANILCGGQVIPHWKIVIAFSTSV